MSKARTSQYSQESTCIEVFSNEVASLKDCNYIKKRLQHGCFPVNIAKFLRTAFLTEHLRWLLLYFRHYKTRKHSQKKRKETFTVSFLISIWDLEIKQIIIHEDHCIRTYVFFILLSCSCGKFEETLVTCNV